ncbi:dTMP kinase [Aliarcobacter butzleri]|uniref:dTMP kinase n=1 Tax=Aliarcobacter butzleri TaxID=28197 RepID=UPI00263E8B9A|nr:dTMP kinase [Aliarcobacter butzleri]MDN5091060.1 dTMP kinase [Aliarcobacter butzleri]
MLGKFIVFEGIDGSGTTTQTELLNNFLLDNNINSVTTCEPSSGPIGNMIREGFKKRVAFVKDDKLFDEQMAYLFAADRHDHLYNEVDGIFELNRKGITTISSRYFFSSLVYHVSNNEEYNFVQKLNEKFPLPDLTIYIDNPVEVSLKRIALRAHRDTYENKEKLEKVKLNYKKVFEEYRENLLIVDGSKSIKEIHDEIKKRVLELYE